MNGARLVICCIILCWPKYNSEAISSNLQKNGSSLVYIHLPATSSPRLMVDRAVRPVIPCLPSFKNRENTLKDSGNRPEKKPTIFQQIGIFMMMIPIGMQLLQLPMAIASVKMSLLKSILVSKMALLVLFLKAIFMNNSREKIIFIQTLPKEHHDHFYLPFENPEDSKPGWLSKPPSWLV